jgi:hypothetical protein
VGEGKTKCVMKTKSLGWRGGGFACVGAACIPTAHERLCSSIFSAPFLLAAAAALAAGGASGTARQDDALEERVEQLE